MKTVYYGTNYDILDEWKRKHVTNEKTVFCYDLESFQKELLTDRESVFIIDYDSVAHSINELISSNTLPKKIILLEKSPEITTGKMLISRGIKAYGNSRMLKIHYQQMVATVKAGKIWTYPELTAQLAKQIEATLLSKESQEIIHNRLSKKEIRVIELILEGLTNDAIAQKLDIKPRTVKAHVGSIFNKLHVNDRISLILLLK